MKFLRANRNSVEVAKGQLILKAKCQAMNSSKRRRNELVFTTMQRVFGFFWKTLKTTKRHFESICP